MKIKETGRVAELYDRAVEAHRGRVRVINLWERGEATLQEVQVAKEADNAARREYYAAGGKRP